MVISAILYIYFVSNTIKLASDIKLLNEKIASLEVNVSKLDHEFILETEGLDMDKAISLGYEKVIDNKVAYITKTGDKVAVR